MRINYLSLLDPFFYEGGGEKDWRSTLQVGFARGHDIKISHVFPTLKINLFDSCDLFILTDLYNHGRTRRPRWLRPVFPNKIIQEIVSSSTYIHANTAYADVCDQCYLPCNGKVIDIDCPHRHGLDLILHGKKCFRRYTGHIFKNALLNVFQSPLHRKVIQGLVGKDVVGRYYEKRMAIDTSKFKNYLIERDIELLFVGVLTEAKGLEEMRRRFADRDLVLAGASKNGKDPGFGRWLGPLPYEEIPKLMNRAKNFVFLPRWPEPTGRVVAEAALCGCNLILNDNVGAISFGYDLTDTENYEKADVKFWEHVEQIL